MLIARVFATVANFMLFFAGSFYRRIRHRMRKHQFEKMAPTAKKPMFHECRVCGLNSDMAPRGSFRYCSQCTGQQCYCKEHIRNHEHVVEKSMQPAVGSGQGTRDREGLNLMIG